MDERRREQERRLDAGADPVAAEAALLAQDLRAGRLTRAQVELAAFVGWPAAVATVGGPAWPATPDERWAWLRGLERDHGRDALVRALAAIAYRRWNSRVPGQTKRHQLLPLQAAVEDLDTWAVTGRKPLTRTRFAGPTGRIVNLARVVSRDREREPGRLPLDDEDLLAARKEVGAWALGRDDAPAKRHERLAQVRREASSFDTPTSSGAIDHHRAFIRSVGGPKSVEDYDD